jgi:putative chitinase
MNSLNTPLSIPNALLISKPQQAQPKHTSKNSHFNKPLTKLNVVNGLSRNWGDITKADQIIIIETLIEQAKNNARSIEEIAFLLAIVRVESGFNPDAAAKLSSAAGLGQFIDRTALSLGIPSQSRFSITENIEALLKLSRESIRWAKIKLGKNADSEQIYIYAYGYYHDGPSLKHQGIEIAKALVIPMQHKFLQFLTTK